MNTATMLPRFALVALLAGCGRDAANEEYKTPGVGLNPDEIGPSPTSQGGLIEYHHIEFAGAALPLGITGLVSFDAVGPASLSMLPPYVMIYGQGFVLSSDIPQMDVAFGTFGTPLNTPGACYTNFEPRAYLNTMADVGGAISFSGEGFQYRLDRRPGMYAENNQQNLFPYYSAIAAKRSSDFTAPVAPADGGFFNIDERQTIRQANWKHGAQIDISFPGGIPPQDASVSSVPMPLKAEGADTTHYLPSAPDGVMMEWEGPLYDEDGNASETRTYRRCLTYADLSYEPETPEDCLERNLPDAGVGTAVQDVLDENGGVVLAKLKGQMYTGPWNTASGVTFRWPESSFSEGETVVVGVRLLGEVDLDSEYKQVARIPVKPSDNLETRWNMFRQSDPDAVAAGEAYPSPYNYIHKDAEMPRDTLYRAPLACEQEGEDFEWEPDPTLYKVEGDPSSGYINSLQGEPTYTVAETICNVPQTANEYTISAETLKYALDYGDLHGASGAVFYFARTTAKDLDTPSVRDRYGNRKDISNVRVLTSSVKVGRFWWDR
jgi:hypothetical protein